LQCRTEPTANGKEARACPLYIARTKEVKALRQC
jgi:hypothetical protein